MILSSSAIIWRISDLSEVKVSSVTLSVSESALTERSYSSFSSLAGGSGSVISTGISSISGAVFETQAKRKKHSREMTVMGKRLYFTGIMITSELLFVK